MAEALGQDDFELWPSLLDAKHEVRARAESSFPPPPPIASRISPTTLAKRFTH